MSKSHRSLCVLFSRASAGLCIYHLLVCSNSNFLHISQCITLPTQLCLVLYFFSANFAIIIIIIIIIYSSRVFHISVSFHWSLSDSKSPQVSKTLLSILADLNNTVVWMVSTRPLISNSSSFFNIPLVTIPRELIRISINVTFMFHIFLQFSSKVQVLILLSATFQFYSVVSWDRKGHNFASSLFFVVVDYYEVWSSGRD